LISKGAQRTTGMDRVKDFWKKIKPTIPRLDWAANTRQEKNVEHLLSINSLNLEKSNAPADIT